MMSLLDREYPRHPGFWETPLTPDMIAQMATLSGPLLSPDGECVAYIRDYDRRADVWVAPVSGGPARLVTADMPSTGTFANAPFTGGYGSGHSWTSDSSAFVYTSSRDGKVYRVSRRGGKVERLSDGAGTHMEPKLAPDGSFLAYGVDRGDIDDQIFVAVQDLTGHTPTVRRLTPSSVVAIDAQISPDGTRVACVLYPLHSRWTHESQVAVIDLVSGDLRVLTPTSDIINGMPRWSPDGSTLAFVSDRSGFLNVYTIPAEGGEAAPLCPEEFEQLRPVWAPDSRRIAYLRNEKADVQAMVATVGAGNARRVSTDAGVHASLSWTPDGRSVCALHQSPVCAPRVMLFDAEGGGGRALVTSAPGGLHDPDLFVMPEHVTWESSDGVEVPGLILAPKRVIRNGHPVLVHPHGGPQGQSQLTWDPIEQYYVARGWAIVKPNYRGSMGYGRRFRDLMRGTWGKGDLADNVTSVNALRERGLVDERRLAIWGTSAGGFATLCAMTMAPGAFHAGVCIAGKGDNISARFQADRYGRYNTETELAPMRDNSELWIEHSPSTHVHQVQAPIMILQGSADRRVPSTQANIMVELLQKAGKVVEHHTFTGEGHGFRSTAATREYINRMEDFLTRHVLLR